LRVDKSRPLTFQSQYFCYSRVLGNLVQWMSSFQNGSFLIGLQNLHMTLKADSHIACRSYATPMPFPCPAVLLRV
jgi:hypothetical protein